MGSQTEEDGYVLCKIQGPNWFSEVNDLWKGQAFSLKVKDILHHEKSKYQDILVFERYSIASYVNWGQSPPTSELNFCLCDGLCCTS